MKQFTPTFSENPSFDTVNDLTNTTFNPDQIVEGRMATEAQIQELERRYTEVEARRNYCCRDIVVWKTYTRIVSPDGIVVSNFIENVEVGTARRGMPFTVTFTPKFDANTFVDYRSTHFKTGGQSVPDIAPFTNNFEIRVSSIPSGNSSGIVQGDREKLDYILINSSSTALTSNYNSSFMDVKESYPGESGVTPVANHSRSITRECSISNAETCGPLREFPVYTTYGGTDGGHFYIYRQNDGTITVDVKDGTVYRGVQNAYPNDPAYLMIFFTQFVLRERV